MNVCADCGNHQAVVADPDGWLCRSCQDERNDKLADIARTIGPVLQPIDPDGPPMPCGMQGCPRDATGITRMYARQGLVGVTACDKHIPAMAKVVASMLATPA